TLGDFLLGLEGLTAGAVMTGIDSLGNIPSVVDRLDKLTAADVMTLFAGLDEVVIGDVEGAPDVLELAGHLVDIRLGLDSQLASALWHLDGILIIAHQEMNRSTLHPEESGLYVGTDLLECRADVRATVGVIDRRGEIITRFAIHSADP